MALQYRHRCTTSWYLVNVRRPIVYVLLSLLLVLSQQMGISHALAHWSSQRAMVTAGDSSDAEPAKSLALDPSCGQCLAFAQIGTAADTGFYSFPIARDNTQAVDIAVAPELCQRTACAFRSRAPPVPS